METTARKNVRLIEGQMMSAEYGRQIWIVTAPAHAVAADYLEPETYAHVINRPVKQGDRLEVTAEDRTWWAEIMIVSVSGLIVQAQMLREVALAVDPSKIHELYEPQWAGPTAKWRVRRKSDGETMVDKLEGKTDAVEWIEKNGRVPVKQAA